MSATHTVFFVNSCDFGSTGVIAKSIKNYCSKKGFQSYFAVGEKKSKNDDDIICISKNKFGKQANRFMCKVNGSDGFRSKKDTMSFCQFLKEKRPEIVNIHNIHGNYLSFPILMETLKEIDSIVVFTLHDCWDFTGKCPHFDISHCEKWKNGCVGFCPDFPNYPRSLFCPSSARWYEKKEAIFNEFPSTKCVFVSPSSWINSFLDNSYLSRFRHIVIHNGINLSLFSQRSTLPKNNKIEILGVANPWSRYKGVHFFNELATALDSDRYHITLIGHAKNVYFSRKISRIDSIPASELQKYYQSSDVLVNCSTSDNYPTVILEALASGLPVITFNTGGCAEPVTKNNGIVVPKDDFSALLKALLSFDSRNFSFLESERTPLSNDLMVSSYFSLFKELLSEN